MDRRQLLKGTAASALTWALARRVSAQTCSVAPSEGTGWGVVPPHLDWPAVDPVTGWPTPEYAGARSYKVLEIFLVGGASAWDSFGAHTTAWDLLREAHERGGCGVDVPGADARLTFAGAHRLAPAVRPLEMELPYSGRAGSTRPGRLFEHMRILPIRHGDQNHITAIPLSLHGLPSSQQRMCATGASLARRFGQTPLPRSFALSPIRPVFGIESADAVGLLPGWTRPMLVDLTGAEQLGARLRRAHFSEAAGGTEAHDALLATYQAQYRQRATPLGCEGPLRSRGLAAYETALDMLGRIGSASESFERTRIASAPFPRAEDGATPTELFCRPLSIASAAAASAVGGATNAPHATLDLAIRLLSEPSGSVRHVVMFDTDLVHDANLFTYDRHDFLADYQDNALHATLSRLAYHIRELNVDLRDTLVVLNTEFGRTAGLEVNLSMGQDRGRNHNPSASFSVLIGGPTVGPYVWGDFVPEGLAGTSVGWTNGANSTLEPSFALPPAASRAAILLAAGVHPLTGPELFEVSDLGRAAIRARGSLPPLSTENVFANLKEAAFRGGIEAP